MAPRSGVIMDMQVGVLTTTWLVRARHPWGITRAGAKSLPTATRPQRVRQHDLGGTLQFQTRSVVNTRACHQTVPQDWARDGTAAEPPGEACQSPRVCVPRVSSLSPHQRRLLASPTPLRRRAPPSRAGAPRGLRGQDPRPAETASLRAERPGDVDPLGRRAG